MNKFITGGCLCGARLLDDSAASCFPALRWRNHHSHGSRDSSHPGPAGLPVATRQANRGGGPCPVGQSDLKLIAALRRANGMIDRQRGIPFISTAPASPHERKLLRLAFLAPDLQPDILAGHQPLSLNLERLRQIEIPLCWKQQRRALGWTNSPQP